jgi:Flp pilus assembly protein TadD
MLSEANAMESDVFVLPLQQARALLEAGRTADAAALLRQAIAQTPSNADLHLSLSVALERLHETDAALASASQAAALKPNDFGLLARLGTLQLGASLFSEAELTMAAVLARHGDNAGYHHVMSIVLERQRKYDSALFHVAESIRLQPDDYNRIRRHGLLALQANRPADAETAFRSAIALRPDLAEYHNLLATSLERQNRFSEALEASGHAVRLDPASAPFAAKRAELAARSEAAAHANELIQSVDTVTLKLLPQNFGHLMFSAFGEDGVLWHLLRNVKNGFYVDIGAHHPVRMSNTALLHNYNGWSGINIDADQRYIDEFNLFRPNDVNICCGVGGEAGRATMAIFADGAINSFDAREIEKSQTKGGREIAELRELEIRTLANVLDTHLPAGKTIDVLNVDAEGWDTAILASNDWTRYRPKLILAEDHTMVLWNVERSATYRLLRDNGYQLFSQTLATSFYRPVP